MMITYGEVQRRIDNSIDVEFYRDRGLMERRAVIASFFKGLGKVVLPSAAVGIVILAVSMMPSRDGGFADRNVTAITEGSLLPAHPSASARLSSPTLAR